MYADILHVADSCERTSTACNLERSLEIRKHILQPSHKVHWDLLNQQTKTREHLSRVRLEAKGINHEEIALRNRDSWHDPCLPPKTARREHSKNIVSSHATECHSCYPITVCRLFISPTGSSIPSRILMSELQAPAPDAGPTESALDSESAPTPRSHQDRRRFRAVLRCGIPRPLHAPALRRATPTERVFRCSVFDRKQNSEDTPCASFSAGRDQ